VAEGHHDPAAGGLGLSGPPAAVRPTVTLGTWLMFIVEECGPDSAPCPF
jgi:hypothetical protein